MMLVAGTQSIVKYLRNNTVEILIWYGISGGNSLENNLDTLKCLTKGLDVNSSLESLDISFLINLSKWEKQTEAAKLLGNALSKIPIKHVDNSYDCENNLHDVGSVNKNIVLEAGLLDCSIISNKYLEKIELRCVSEEVESDKTKIGIFPYELFNRNTNLKPKA